MRVKPAGWRVYRLALLLAAVLAVGQERAVGDLFFWRASGSANHVYLLGSIHVGERDMYPLDPLIESTFARVPNLVVEVDLAAEAENMAALVMRHGFYPAGQSLKSDLPPGIYARALARGRLLGLPAASVLQMRPWLLALTIGVLDASAAGFEPAIGVDAYLIGRSAGKRIIALESADYQIGLFSSLPVTLQARLLKETLAADADLGSLASLLELWRAGDAEQLTAVMHGALDHGDGAELYEQIFVQRNRQMARAIGELLDQSQDYFVVVGVGHFLGPQNVLELLAAENIFAVRLPAAR